MDDIRLKAEIWKIKGTFSEIYMSSDLRMNEFIHL